MKKLANITHSSNKLHDGGIKTDENENLSLKVLISCFDAKIFFCKIFLEILKNEDLLDFARPKILVRLALSPNCNVDKYKMIMELSEDKNPIDKFGSTPLHVAARWGNFNLCKMILEHVDNKNPRNEYGKTPLDHAKEQGHENICKLIKSVLDTQNGNLENPRKRRKI